MQSMMILLVTWVYSSKSMVGETTGIDYTNPRHVQK